MHLRKILNKIIRILLLAVCAFAVIIYSLGIAANVFGWLEMRRSDNKILALLKASAGDQAFVGNMNYGKGLIAYAGVSCADADSVAVFFVHGSPGSLDACVPFLRDAHLASHASLYAYDRLGYGNSLPAEGGTSLEAQSAQLFALVKKIGARRNIFVGHSLGCSIIAEFAMEHPDDIDGMVLVAAPIDPGLEPSTWWRSILEYPMISIAIPRSMRISNIELWPLKKDLEKCLPRWVNVRCPVTLIHGDIDNLVPVENVAFGKRVLKNASEVREVILHKDGHFIFWSRHDLIVDEIVRMIEDVANN